MSALTVENLTVSYGDIHAVKGISFEVRKGEIFTLIGARRRLAEDLGRALGEAVVRGSQAPELAGLLRLRGKTSDEVSARALTANMHTRPRTS